MSISKEYIARFLPSNPVIVEAGAHSGKDTVSLCKLWPSGTIYAFEPIPIVFKQLVERTKECTNVYCYPLALSSSNGTALLYVSEQCTQASSLLEPYRCLEEHPERIFEPIEVSTITLDAWAQQENITHVDFLWLDLQGAELAVLRASPRIVSTVSVIHTEVNLFERYKDAPLYQEICQWLESQGFSAVQEAIGPRGWGDVLFVRL